MLQVKHNISLFCAGVSIGDMLYVLYVNMLLRYVV